MSKLFDKVVDFVNTSFNGKNVEHFDRTVYWIKKLDPKAGDALRIAGYGHDIERSTRKEGINKKTFPNDKELRYHQERGGEIIRDFLLRNGADPKLAKEVGGLISKHEIGGNQKQNILKDADSVSYFECNAIRHVGWVQEKGMTKKEIRKKFDWMFERITSKKAKKIAEPMYAEVLKLLVEI